ncbi:hypothetical protein [Chitinophaga filiformis]|uniref:Uncharacterized protein n=1 Tax=Chitinophaga filiformis TaxID=104663 RepID=A0A1G7MN57_CHIFI|nr:hypothetical protein [Chitinophaga filiformis]SDF63147.1 hypothetical protein SAMN04488121_102502 [Chitinophaga filiformis]
MKLQINWLFAVFITGVMLVNNGCHSVAVERQAANLESGKDTLKKETVVAGTHEEDFEPQELEDIYNEYTRYDDTLSVDTSYSFKGKQIRVKFRHYCLYDSSLAIPDVYTKIYGIKDFVSNTYQSKLEVSVDDNEMIDTIITRDIFYSDNLPALKNYGVLRSGSVNFNEDSFEVRYSLSIPLTDIGEAVVFKVHL